MKNQFIWHSISTKTFSSLKKEQEPVDWDARFYDVAKEEFLRQSRVFSCEEIRAERAVTAASAFIGTEKAFQLKRKLTNQEINMKINDDFKEPALVWFVLFKLKETWFCGQGSCRCIGFAREIMPSEYMWMMTISDAPLSASGQRMRNFSSRAGLYALILSSKLPQAKESSVG
jgi:hypothetical protein